ncbi:MAG: sel1 repeat family protein [Rhizobiaceae bacterium]|jgi:hypothetical protein|nr:sel1 repeat family protein [Rhizobiaceae bacterium]
MRISDVKALIIVTLVGAGMGFMPAPARAFDASRIIENDTSSTKIFEFFYNFKREGRPQEAVEVLKYAAGIGNSAAQWKLARIYQTGDGVQADHERAFEMYKEIAAQYPFARPNTPNWQFSADALVALGDYYKNGVSGTSIKVDVPKAQMMYTTAAMVFRHPDAQFELGRMQLLDEQYYGQHRLGIRNLNLAYGKGHVGAEALLGYSIFEGEHTKRDPVRGLVMLGNAKRRANSHDLEWISTLHDDAFAIASPEQRTKAFELLEASASPSPLTQ